MVWDIELYPNFSTITLRFISKYRFDTIILHPGLKLRNCDKCILGFVTSIWFLMITSFSNGGNFFKTQNLLKISWKTKETKCRSGRILICVFRIWHLSIEVNHESYNSLNAGISKKSYCSTGNWYCHKIFRRNLLIPKTIYRKNPWKF